MKASYLSLCVSALLVVNSQAQGFGVNWGTGTFPASLLTSDGSPLTPDGFSFELGGFTSGFVPSAANINEWIENWRIFDGITFPDADSSDGFVETGAGSRFVGNASLNAMQISDSEDADMTFAFVPGTQAYVFVRNSDDSTPGSEWLLYTREGGGGWVFPVVSGLAFSENWFTPDANQVIFGAINGMSVNDGTTGEFTDTSTDFLLRTHTFVPEPSSFFLFLLGALGLLARRSRL